MESLNTQGWERRSFFLLNLESLSCIVSLHSLPGSRSCEWRVTRTFLSCWLATRWIWKTSDRCPSRRPQQGPSSGACLMWRRQPRRVPTWTRWAMLSRLPAQDQLPFQLASLLRDPDQWMPRDNVYTWVEYLLILLLNSTKVYLTCCSWLIIASICLIKRGCSTKWVYYEPGVFHCASLIWMSECSGFLGRGLHFVAA